MLRKERESLGKEMEVKKGERARRERERKGRTGCGEVWVDSGKRARQGTAVWG